MAGFKFKPLTKTAEVSEKTKKDLGNAGKAGAAAVTIGAGSFAAHQASKEKIHSMSGKDMKKIDKAKDNIRRNIITTDTITAHDAINKPTLVGRAKRAVGRSWRRGSINRSKAKIGKLKDAVERKNISAHTRIGAAAKKGGKVGALVAGAAGLAVVAKKQYDKKKAGSMGAYSVKKSK